MVDLGTADDQQSRQNQRVFSVQVFRQNETAAWAQVEPRFTLHDVAAAVGSSLGGTAKARLSTSVAAEFPDSLTTNMGPFDAFFTFEPASASQAITRHIPINANFATRYRVDVLEPLAATGREDAWSLADEDLLDIGSFAFFLPMLLGNLHFSHPVTYSPPFSRPRRLQIDVLVEPEQREHQPASFRQALNALLNLTIANEDGRRRGGR
jgi:hypothetical protein